ncbi:MAG: hypothetical protein IT453_20020 [Planctomycetes bacterium]|nr:hypothetical protein [Planctomycetota bacterium]
MTAPIPDPAKLERILSVVEELRIVRASEVLLRMECVGPDGEAHAVRFNAQRWSMALDAMLASLAKAQKRKAGRAAQRKKRRARWSSKNRLQE